MNNFYDEISKHLSGKNCRNFWTYEKCKEVAALYRTRNEFQKNNKNFLLLTNLNSKSNTPCCPHM